MKTNPHGETATLDGRLQATTESENVGQSLGSLIDTPPMRERISSAIAPIVAGKMGWSTFFRVGRRASTTGEADHVNHAVTVIEVRIALRLSAHKITGPKGTHASIHDERHFRRR
jgi:hypothetical protein